MKTEEQISDELAQYKERIHDMLNEKYNPQQPQLTNLMCLCSYIDALKWVLHNNNNNNDKK